MTTGAGTVRGMTRDEAIVTDAFRNTGASSSRDAGGKGIAPVLLFALFMVLLLLALVAGLRSYSNEVDSSNESKESRLSVGFLVNTVRNFDTTGFIRTSDGPEGDALVLVQYANDMEFETRIYKYDGNLMQEYAVAGTPYTPQNATVLFPTEQFAFDVEGELLTIDTDEGTANVALRCADPLASGSESASGSMIISGEVILS